MDATIRNEHGERLDYTFVAGDPSARRLVVIGHGVTANKDRPWLVALSDALRRRGIPSLRVSFSGNGESDGRFEDSTVTKEAADLGSVLDALPQWDVVFVGHSMGAAVGLLVAAKDERIRAFASLAGMVHTADFVRRKFGDLTPGASFMWDKPECPLSQAFVDDLTGLDTLASLAASVRAPWLLVHGDADTVVPIDDAYDVHRAASKRPDLVVLEGADHVFSGSATEDMTRVVVAWIEAGYRV